MGTQSGSGLALNHGSSLTYRWILAVIPGNFGLAVRDPGSVSYSAAIESAGTHDTAKELAEFSQRVEREATRRGFREAQRSVVLGDGAPWIWCMADEMFPAAIQIVDRYHVKEHLSDLAKVLYGPGTLRAKRWAEQRSQELDQGQLNKLQQAIRRHARTSDQAGRSVNYFRRNRHRMRYPEFHAQGLCTSSGVLEAGCKVAVGVRLKRSGMHWTLAGGNAIIALRCCRLSGRFEDFWEHRTGARAA